MNGHLFVLIGPSGAGKTSLVKKVKAAGLAQPVVTCTTRAPRPGEANGVDYHFLSPQCFENYFSTGKLIEREEIHGNWYGTPVSGISNALSRGQNSIIAMGFAGARLVKARWPNHVSLIYIIPPSIEELRKRLKSRGASQSELNQRLDNVSNELTLVEMADTLIENEDLDEAFRELSHYLDASKGTGYADTKPFWTSERSGNYDH